MDNEQKPPETPAHPHEQPVSIQDEMPTSYLDYAMSVIIGRAIPDVRDGLKPCTAAPLCDARPQSRAGRRDRSARSWSARCRSFHPHGDAASTTRSCACSVVQHAPHAPSTGR